jgi:PleD family two-component response regulator
LAQERILVVEDEYLVAHDISNMLLDLGYEVAGVVSTAEEAMNAVRERPPDLVLLDIVLKGAVDGVTLAKLIKEESAIPIVFLTAHADEMTLSRAKFADPLGYLLKPFEFRELKTVVELAFFKHAKEREAGFWAIHDRLSGLPNKIFFLEHVRKAVCLASRHRGIAAVLAVALTPKDVSFPEADVVPLIVGPLSGILRKSDTLARLMSGEFLVLLQDLQDEAQARTAASRILKPFETPLKHRGREIPLAVASGLAMSDPDNLDPEILIGRALDALAAVLRKDKG